MTYTLEGGSPLMYDLRNLAIPFGILLTKYAFQLIVDKNKKGKGKKLKGKKQKGGACTECGCKKGGFENASIQNRHVQNELDEISRELRAALSV